MRSIQEMLDSIEESIFKESDSDSAFEDEYKNLYGTQAEDEKAIDEEAWEEINRASQIRLDNKPVPDLTGFDQVTLNQAMEIADRRKGDYATWDQVFVVYQWLEDTKDIDQAYKKAKHAPH